MHTSRLISWAAYFHIFTQALTITTFVLQSVSYRYFVLIFPTTCAVGMYVTKACDLMTKLKHATS